MLASCCASAASGAASKSRVSATIHAMALHHMVISSSQPQPICFFPWKPNAQAHLRPEAAAERHEAEAGGSQVQRRVRCSAGAEARPMGSVAQEPHAYGQVRGVMPF